MLKGSEICVLFLLKLEMVLYMVGQANCKMRLSLFTQIMKNHDQINLATSKYR